MTEADLALALTALAMLSLRGAGLLLGGVLAGVAGWRLLGGRMLPTLLAGLAGLLAAWAGMGVGLGFS
jgi:hypothetical protein